MLSKRSRSGFCAAPVMLLLVSIIAFASASAYAEADATWLQIDKFKVSMPASVGHDQFVLEGQFNMPLTLDSTGEALVIESTDVTLNIDSSWSEVFPADSWRRVGASRQFVARQDHVLAMVTFFVKGSSKCLFKFIGSQQSLNGNIPGMPSVPVELQIGTLFDETVTAEMKGQHRLFKLDSVGPEPQFFIRSLLIERDANSVGGDRMAFTGVLFVDGGFNPASDDVTLTVGTYELVLPAGTLKSNGRNMSKHLGKTPGDGTLFARFDSKTGQLVVMAGKLDLSAVTRDVEVGLTVSGHDGAAWAYTLTAAENGPQTVLKY